MKTFNWILIGLFSVLMLMGESTFAQRGRRGSDNSCTVPSRRGNVSQGTLGDFGRTYTQRGRDRYRSPYVGTYYKNRKRLPNRADRILYRGTSFFYLDGLFYQKMRRGFIVVNPPLGLQIDRRPYKAERIRYRGRVYFKSGSFWFMKQRNGAGFVLVRNPFR